MGPAATVRGGRAALSSAERVCRMLEHRDHDRVPRHDQFWPETLVRWSAEGMPATDAQTVLQMLGSDFRQVCWSWPKPFPGRQQVVAEEETTRIIIDEMGNRQRVSKVASTTPEHIAFGCSGPDEWFASYKPALLKCPLQMNLADAASASALAREQQQWAFFAGIECVTAIHQLVGDETALVAAATDVDWIADMAATYTDLLIGEFDRLRELGIVGHGLWIFGDMAFNHGPFFSPESYRSLYLPQHRRMADWAHRHGMKLIYHTDGDVRLLIDDLIAAGIDCLQPLEAKAGLNLRDLSPRYGSRLCFFGNVDMTVAITNDPDRIEQEVRCKLQAGKSRANYAYHSDHSVPPQVSWSSYLRIIEMLDRYGNY